MATKKKSLPKAQIGTASTDSTAYYSNLSKKYFDKAASVRNAPYGGRLIKEQSKERLQKENEYNQKAFEAIDNQLRQSRKGKQGYDKNGNPTKKKGGSVKSKSKKK